MEVEIIRKHRAIAAHPGSARWQRAGRRLVPRRTFTESLLRRTWALWLAVRRKFATGRRRRSAELALIALSLCATGGAVRAQDAVAEHEEIVVSATRFAIPEESSPATVSVVTDDEMEERQTRRVADALREVPGISVVQTGPPGQLTSVFTRGLRSEHTQVLLDGIPINQGLQGAFNFGAFTTDNIAPISVLPSPQSTIYGPRALAGAIQSFTRRGEGPPTSTWTI